MSGYFAAARIERARPRIVERGPARRDRWGRERAADSPVEILAATIAAATDAPDAELLLGERWASVRERWSQLTFYLFSADGWR
jgi:hypothetical protein